MTTIATCGLSNGNTGTPAEIKANDDVRRVYLGQG